MANQFNQVARLRVARYDRRFPGITAGKHTGQAIEPKLTFLFIRSMTTSAVLVQDGLDVFFELHVRGNGEQIERCVVDGREVAEAVLDAAPGTRDVEIRLGAKETKNGQEAEHRADTQR